MFPIVVESNNNMAVSYPDTLVCDVDIFHVSIDCCDLYNNVRNSITKCSVYSGSETIPSN